MTRGNDMGTVKEKYQSETASDIFLSKECNEPLQKTPEEQMDKYMNIEDLSEYLNYSPSYVYANWRKWAVSGLRVILIGPTPRFRKEDVERWSKKRAMVTV